MKLVLVLLSALLSVATYAQTLTGKIIDQQNQPVPFANILALDADSVFIRFYQWKCLRRRRNFPSNGDKAGHFIKNLLHRLSRTNPPDSK